MSVDTNTPISPKRGMDAVSNTPIDKGLKKPNVDNVGMSPPPFDLNVSFQGIAASDSDSDSESIRNEAHNDAYFLKAIGLAESTDEIYRDIHERTASRIHTVALQWWACLVHVPVDQACWASFDVFLDKLLQVVDLAVLELIRVNCFVNA